MFYAAYSTIVLDDYARLAYSHHRCMNVQEELKKIKQELTDLIVLHLQENKIDPEAAQQQAADFLAILPINDQADLLQKLKALGDKYLESRQIYLEEITKFHELEREQALTQMRNAIKLGNIDHAIAVAKAMKGGK